MSALDQAFFKAYGLAEEPDEAAEPEVASAVETVSATGTESSSLGEPSCLLKDPEPGLSVSGSILAWGPWQAEGPDPLPDQAGVGMALEVKGPAPPQAGPVAEEKSTAALDEPAEGGPANHSTEAPETPEPAGQSPRPAPDGAMPAPEKECRPVGFLPQLQVDRYFWPATVVRLCQVAEGPLDAVIDMVAFEAAQGRNVVGVGHCRSGDGATTLLLCLARRLADHGVKVAIVDADLRSPCLARRLGVLAEAGWDDARSRGVPLAEVVIESAYDRLALVPRQEAKGLSPDGKGKAASAGGAPGGQAETISPQAVVAELRLHYDVVLVDLGHCGKDVPMLAAAGQRAWIDRVILVRNQRRPRPAEFAQAVRQLRSLGIDVAVVNNFV